MMTETDHVHHSHGHVSGPIERYEHVRGGAPILDIGGDIGALLATMDHGTAGTELFLRPDRNPEITVHTGVWERQHNGSAVTAAVFPELLEGTYHVLDDDGFAVRTVEIRGGAVATIDLRH